MDNGIRENNTWIHYKRITEEGQDKSKCREEGDKVRRENKS